MELGLFGGFLAMLVELCRVRRVRRFLQFGWQIYMDRLDFLNSLGSLVFFMLATFMVACSPVHRSTDSRRGSMSAPVMHFSSSAVWRGAVVTTMSEMTPTVSRVMVCGDIACQNFCF